MTSSGAGDQLGVQLQSNNPAGTNMRVSGWFDIKHTCAETGKVIDHSGPNALVESGLRAMLSACTLASVTNEVNLSGKVGFAFSATDLGSGFAKGDAVTCGTAGGNDLTTITTGIEANSASETFDTTPGLLLDGSSLDVFTGSSITRSGATATLITHNNVVLTLKATATTTINSIILGADGGTATTVTPIAVKTAAFDPTSDTRGMDTITMNNNDTLTVKYTLEVVAS